MSGGSYDYLCHKDADEILGAAKDLRRMANRLDRVCAEAAAETRAIFDGLGSTYSELEKRIDRLRDLWKAIEWRDSSDWGEQAVIDAVKAYLAKEPWQSGELSGTMRVTGVSEQDAVRDAYVAHLENALRTIAAGVEPGIVTIGGKSAAEIATEALGIGDIERIPDGVSFPPPGKVAFTRYPASKGDWHLIGPANLLEPGGLIEVQRFTERDPTLVAVGQVVAERTVIHRKQGPTRYVVARISKAVRD